MTEEQIRFVETKIIPRVVVNPLTQCWVWQGCRNKGGNGYGSVNYQKKTWLLHRLVYLFYKGPFPQELCVLHSCDNRACCNPEHLWLGTNDDNVRDKMVKGRYYNGDVNISKTHCKHGHEFNEENTWVAKDGSRHCRTCNRIRAEKLRRREGMSIRNWRGNR